MQILVVYCFNIISHNNLNIKYNGRKKKDILYKFEIKNINTGENKHWILELEVQKHDTGKQCRIRMNL